MAAKAGSKAAGVVIDDAAVTPKYVHGFEAKRELHRRFTKEQRVGFLFDMKWTGDIQVHPEIEQFAFDASKLFDELDPPPPPGDPRITEAVKQLAAERFGPFEG